MQRCILACLSKNFKNVKFLVKSKHVHFFSVLFAILEANTLKEERAKYRFKRKGSFYTYSENSMHRINLISEKGKQL